jgi:hypothetical protein
MCKNYTDGVVIFLDLLGTKSRVRDFSKAYNAQKVFINLVEVERHLDAMHPQSIYERFVTVFSDSAYIIYNYKPNTPDAQKDRRKLLLIACDNTEKIICTLLQQGILVRGGLTYDKVFHEKSRDNNTLCFGEAMNEAYRLEDEVAVVPRVVVEKECAQEVVALTAELKKNDPGGWYDHYNIVTQDDIKRDGEYIINFMNTLERGFATVDGPSMLSKINEMCETEKQNMISNIRHSLDVYDKYAWLEKFVKVHGSNIFSSPEMPDEDFQNLCNGEMTEREKTMIAAAGIDINQCDESKTLEQQVLEDSQ